MPQTVRLPDETGSPPSGGEVDHAFMFILKMGKFEPGCDPMTDIREGTEEI